MNDYPIGLDIPYGDGARSKGLAVAGILYFVKALLILPHAIVIYFVYIVTAVLAWVGYIAIAFTGVQPEAISRMVSGTIGWWTRVSAWLASLTDIYPPFAFEASDYPVRVAAAAEPGERSRPLAVAGIFGVKVLLAFPHLFAVGLVSFAAGVAAWIGFWYIAFTGTLPQGIHDFVTGAMRWNARVFGWLGSLTDRYPPFSLT